MAQISKEVLDRNFALIEAAAANGDRCPQASPHGPIHPSTAPADLARAGRIRIEIFTLNWRVATVLEGPHKGKRTAACPHGGSGKPYKVITADGVSSHTRMGMQPPSAPRPLTREELA